MDDSEEKKMMGIIDRIEKGEIVSENELNDFQRWYAKSVQSLKDDIDITKIKKSFEI